MRDCGGVHKLGEPGLKNRTEDRAISTPAKDQPRNAINVGAVACRRKREELEDSHGLGRAGKLERAVRGTLFIQGIRPATVIRSCQ
jgi:hypothetical protein